jgi:dUTP pyrophosphatase
MANKEIEELEYLKTKLEELKSTYGDMEDISEDDLLDDNDSIYEEYGLDLKQLEEDMNNYNTTLPLGYKKLQGDVKTPSYNYGGDSGFDLYSTEEITIPPFGRVLVPTGLAFDIQDGYEIQVRSKSGLAINQGLMVLNSPGTVDNSYNSEVKVIIFNTNQTSFIITKGMKVAQAVLCPVVNGKWVELKEINEIPDKDRGDRGFGSTGI